jgi:hypothetical protein
MLLCGSLEKGLARGDKDYLLSLLYFILDKKRDGV